MENPAKMDSTQKEVFIEHRKQQLQLKKKRKAERKQLEALHQREEELMFKKDQTGEVQELKEIIKKLQEKCGQQSQEIKDLAKETNDQKQELMLVIRDQD